MSSTPATTSAPPVRISAGWYVAALIIYVVIAYFTKTVLLNWVMGPLFLLFTLYIIPTAAAAGLRKLKTRTSR